jgi:cobalt-zinc-cadmium efflux system protein
MTGTQAEGRHTHFGELARQAGARLRLALILTFAFLLVEAMAGAAANSLALITDAVHNLTDVMALALSWYAVRIATNPANSQKTYGYHRAGILAALANSLVLVLLSIGIFYEAYQRLQSPVQVQAGILVIAALAAAIVNLVTALLVRHRAHSDLNLRSAFVHLAGDVLSTLGAVAAGVVIYFTNAYWLDPLVSVLIGILILYTAWGILRETIEILLESTPRDVDLKAMVKDIVGVQGVEGVHDLHVWSLTGNLRTMSAHLLTEDVPISRGTLIQEQVAELLRKTYGIAHSTLQLECRGHHPGSLYCDINGLEYTEPDSAPGKPASQATRRQ